MSSTSNSVGIWGGSSEWDIISLYRRKAWLKTKLRLLKKLNNLSMIQKCSRSTRVTKLYYQKYHWRLKGTHNFNNNIDGILFTTHVPIGMNLALPFMPKHDAFHPSQFGCVLPTSRCPSFSTIIHTKTWSTTMNVSKKIAQADSGDVEKEVFFGLQPGDDVESGKCSNEGECHRPIPRSCYQCSRAKP